MSITADSTVTSKGQVTIPKEIRDRLGLEQGQEVEFVLEDDGTMRVRPKQAPMERLREIRDTITARDEAVDLAAMRRRAKREWSSLDDTDVGHDG